MKRHARKRWLKKVPAKMKPHPPYLQVYKAVCGWQIALYCWDSEDGFYDCMQTGFGPYGFTKKGYDVAVAEAKGWGRDEEIADVRIPAFTKGRG